MPESTYRTMTPEHLGSDSTSASMLMDGRIIARHSVWYIHLDGEPVGPAFKTRAEATYYFHREYAERESATLA